MFGLRLAIAPGVEGEEKEGNNNFASKKRRLISQSKGLITKPAGSLG